MDGKSGPLDTQKGETAAALGEPLGHGFCPTDRGQALITIMDVMAIIIRREWWSWDLRPRRSPERGALLSLDLPLFFERERERRHDGPVMVVGFQDGSRCLVP